MKKVITGFVSVALLVAVVVGFTWRQQLKDQFIVATTELQPKSAKVLHSLALTDYGTFLYKASQPKVQSAEDFNKSCAKVAKEHSIVLGCYTNQIFYVYDVKDPRLDGVKQVTAAHELLHAAYERLPSDEKAALDTQLNQLARSIDDQKFQKTVEEYRSSQPSQLTNELHSIIGTEIEVLPAQLEDHYKTYFSDRAKIVAFSKEYEDTFEQIESQREQLEEQSKNLLSQKQKLEQTLQQQQADIESQRAQLNSLQSSGDAEQYNQQVPGYNADIRSYNVNVAQLKQVIEEYNSIVEQLNLLATNQNDLVKQLDSDYQELQ